MTKTVKAPSKELATTLADFLCFSVYSTNLAFGRVYKPLLDEIGLTYPQFVTLVALSEQDDHTVGSLGKKLFLESSTLTPLLKRLEAMGYVTRRRDPDDERQVRVGLTKAGRNVREKAFCNLAPIITATGLTPDDFRRIQKELCALRDSLLAASEARVQGI
jgi:DNA-binding MarR family transcriptional regulator